MGAAEKVQLLNHFLLTVSLTKERPFRLKISKEVMAITEKDVRRMETTMKEIKEYMADAERELKSSATGSGRYTYKERTSLAGQTEDDTDPVK
ncbi:unnamed protein product [Haemonchus placei]|uniref:Troponin T n=1 Tax=Haemonchus placei TaxID=6290 RepID=A0A0N4WVP3_HAEPC|nr:unnamed protein product [Haemonchus placei]